MTQDTDPEKNSDYLASLSKSIKSLDSSLVVSHAPQYPYFGPSYYDVYTLVNTKAGDAIDFYNLQYYNNGDTSTYDLVFVANPFEAAVQQLLIPVQKIVVGKSMDLSVLTSWVTQAASDSSLMDWRNKKASWSGNCLPPRARWVLTSKRSWIFSNQSNTSLTLSRPKNIIFF